MERLKMMKEQLMAAVQGQLGDLSSVDSKELGEAIDMIKDLSEAVYYCSIVKSMEDSEKEPKYYPIMYRDMDRNNGRMYYEDNGNSMTRNYPIELRDYREGQSPLTRKTYMERKMHGGDKTMQMHDLEKYMMELSHDLTEMVEGSSLEEKQMLAKKLTALAGKIA